MMLRVAIIMLLTAVPVRAEQAVSSGRPIMQPMPPAESRSRPPSARELLDVRREFNDRYGELLRRAKTASGASLAAELFVNAAAVEPDRALKWLLLDQARKLAVDAGNAGTLDRAVVMASATYEFDELDHEYRALAEIPLRGLDPQRAASLAEVAEKVATRAETDGRRDLALSAQTLAVRGWQRAGARDAARRAAIRHAEMGRIGPEH